METISYDYSKVLDSLEEFESNIQEFKRDMSEFF
jgi:hypothetical protein